MENEWFHEASFHIYTAAKNILFYVLFLFNLQSKFSFQGQKLTFYDDNGEHDVCNQNVPQNK